MCHENSTIPYIHQSPNHLYFTDFDHVAICHPKYNREVHGTNASRDISEPLPYRYMSALWPKPFRLFMRLVFFADRYHNTFDHLRPYCGNDTLILRLDLFDVSNNETS